MAKPVTYMSTLVTWTLPIQIVSVIACLYQSLRCLP